jgi:anti-sigma factor (TIGR02949 family)
MIGCDEAMGHLWEYLDGTVEVNELSQIEEHLARCLRCCGERDFAIELRRFLSSQAADDLPDDVAQRLNRAIDELGR